jgi:hypothetical protein
LTPVEAAAADENIDASVAVELQLSRELEELKEKQQHQELEWKQVLL